MALDKVLKLAEELQPMAVTTAYNHAERKLFDDSAAVIRALVEVATAATELRNAEGTAADLTRMYGRLDRAIYELDKLNDGLEV